MPCNGFVFLSLPSFLSLSPFPLFTVNLRLTPIPSLQQLQCGSRAGLLTLDQNSAKKEVAPGNGLVSHQSYACVMQTVSQQFPTPYFCYFSYLFGIFCILFLRLQLAVCQIYFIYYLNRFIIYFENLFRFVSHNDFITFITC